MHSQKFLLAICTLFVTSTNGFSVQLGKRLDPGERSFPEFARLAEPVIQRRDVSLKRQDSIGAWALRTVKCPDTTNLCDKGFPAMEACCPKNLFCVGSSFRIACCPTESSCIQTASTFPKCGDPSWTLWAGSREHFFCCPAGDIGYVTDDNSGACGPSSLKPTGKQVATSLTQQNNNDAPPTSVPDSNDNGTSSTPPPPNTTLNAPITASSDAVNPPVTNDPNGTDGETTNTPDNDDDNGNTDQNGNKDQNGNTDPPSSSSQSNGGLATGAIAGIAAGGILLLILAGVGIFFALRAGKKRGAKEALASFQQQQRSMPGPDFDHRNPDYHNNSGPSTPGAFGAGNQGKFGQEAEVKPQVMPNVAEKYGEGVQPPVPVASPPPQQHQWNAPQDRVPRYEADAANVYPNSRYAEMEGYNNQHR